MSTLTRLERGAAPLRKVTIDRLDQLAGALAGRGLRASMVAPAGRMPRLQVTRPDPPHLGEDVYAWRCHDGIWWFWWPWAERIAAAADVAAAAERIERALTSSRAE